MTLRLIIAAMTLLSSNFAGAADLPAQFRVITTCASVDAGPDHGLRITLLSSTADGTLQIQASEQSISGPINHQSYIVQQVPPDRHRMGAPMVFQNENEGLRFSVNMTTAPSMGHPGSLTLHGSSTALTCK